MNSSIWYFPLSALINAVTSTVLGFYLLFTSYKKRVARYLLYFCVSVAVWSYGYFMWQMATDAESAFFWCRALMFGAIFTSISFFHLVLVFLEIDKQRFYKIVLFIFYLFSFVWVAVNFTNYFVDRVEATSYFKFWPMAGPFYAPFLAAFFAHVLYASVLLFKNYRKSVGHVKIQTVLLLIGIFIAFVGGSTNYPLWYGIDIAPWGNALVSLYVILTVYAMMRYKLMDVKVVSAELFAGVVFIIFLIDVFLSNNLSEFVFRFIALVFMGAFGVMLIRAVRKEVRRREEVTELAKSLEKANLRLKELDQQKTEFLSIASHQLRTPLSIIKGYVELIKDGAYGKTTTKMTKVLDDMDASNERLVKLVDEFLNISRIEQGRTKFDFKQCDLRETISSVVKELKEKADEQCRKIIWVPQSIECRANIDEEKIRNVVFNYIDNAFKYSDCGEVVVSLESEDDGWDVKVRDNGLGFGKVDGANFFQKFYRGENVKGTNVNGTGLGLYVCRKFIEAHNGKVWAKSDGLGKGSEFGFWIPFAFSPKT